MSGFSVDWLSLREPVDHRSVNAQVRAAFVADMARHNPVRITDIGCGSGSHLRSLAPHLGMSQSWRLVDYDQRLLSAARQLLLEWADAHEPRGDGLVLFKEGRRIEVGFLQADLTQDLETALSAPCDAITAAAFFDLASPAFIAAFAGAVQKRGLPFYTILTYDGREGWTPPHPVDQAMLAAFNAHQQTDKGFGPAAGPGATDALEAAFASHGYACLRGDSPWVVSRADAGLMSELARGIARAVGETGKLSTNEIDGWLAAHLDAQGCRIGHQDFYARPR